MRYIILKHRQAILSVEKLYYFLFFSLFFKDLYGHALKSLHLYVFSSDNDFFFLSFLFFLFLRLSRFPDCIFLFFLFFFTFMSSCAPHCFSFSPLSYFFASVFSSAYTSSSRTRGNLSLSSFIPLRF